MLYIVKQYKALLFSMLRSELDTPKNPVASDKTDKVIPLNQEGKELKEKLNDDKKSVVKETVKKKEKLGGDLKTKEENNYIIGTFGGKIDGKKLRKRVNVSSLKKILFKSGSELRAIYDQIINIANENNLKVDHYYFAFYNIGELKKAFRSDSIGYKSKKGFGGEEMGALFRIIEDVVSTQEKLPKLNFRDKLAIIFDYNIDGVLDNEVDFYTKEKQVFDVIQTEEEFDNLLKNLGYSSKEEFDRGFQDNYYSAREEFKTRLATDRHAESVLNLGEYLNNPEASKEFSEYLRNLNKAVEEEFEDNKKTKDLPLFTKEALKSKSINILLGDNIGASLSVNDLRKRTKGLIDSFTFGATIDGIYGIGIKRKILDIGKGRGQVDAGLVNLTPFVGANGVIKKGELHKFKKLFPEEFSSKTKITLGGTFSLKGRSATLGLSRKDEGSKEGIQEAKSQMSSILDKLHKDIKYGKTFDKSSFSQEKSNKTIYERLSAMFKANGGDFARLKEGALNNYERVLYKNAEGLNLTGIGISLVDIANFLPIIIPMVSLQSHKIEWTDVESYNFNENLRENTLDSEYVESSEVSNDEKFLNHLKSFEKGFSFRTRYNKGALALMRPSNSLYTRFDGLLKLSTGVAALREVNLNSFLVQLKTAEDKFAAVSTFSQYMKKAKDFGNESKGDSWNTKTDEFISKDVDRRKAFDTMFGFSLNQEAEEYYKKLSSAKGKIGDTEIVGVGFDATSSVQVEGKGVKGIDTLYTNLRVLTVDGEPLLIPITDPKKIEAFKGKLNNLNISDSIKKKLLKQIDDGTLELNFYKDPDGFDDRIIPISKRPKGVKNIETFKPEYSTTDIGIAYAKTPRRDRDSITTDPGVDIETTPGAIEGTVVLPDGTVVNPTDTPIYGRDGELIPMVDLSDFAVERGAGYGSNPTEDFLTTVMTIVPTDIPYIEGEKNTQKGKKKYMSRLKESIKSVFASSKTKTKNK